MFILIVPTGGGMQKDRVKEDIELFQLSIWSKNVRNHGSSWLWFSQKCVLKCCYPTLIEIILLIFKHSKCLLSIYSFFATLTNSRALRDIEGFNNKAQCFYFTKLYIVIINTFNNSLLINFLSRVFFKWSGFKNKCLEKSILVNFCFTVNCGFLFLFICIFFKNNFWESFADSFIHLVFFFFFCN